MTLLSTVAGVLLISLALRDVFQELFHPSGRGTLSLLFLRATSWLLCRLKRILPFWRSLVGPLGMLAVISAWAVLLTLGWALVYLPWLPERFQLMEGLAPQTRGGLGDALYFSLTTLTTLGYGDIVPLSAGLRLLAPVEALMGFGLLSASITWVLSLYPVLARRRLFAHEAHLLLEGVLASPEALLRLESSEASALLHRLAVQVLGVRDDFIHFSASGYFHSSDARTALEPVMPRLLHLALQLQAQPLPEAVRAQAHLLEHALEDFALTLSERLLRIPPRPAQEVLAAYARLQHLRAS